MGGAATNSGIDFQSRVGAFAMVSMFAEVQEMTAVGGADTALVERVHFETTDDVDDLTLATRNNRSFIQAKRTISLSAEEDSEFSSVIGQFVGQHVSDPGTGSDTYVLATTSAASSRITGELRRIGDAARLNRGHAVNPTTKTEVNVRDITYAHIDRHFATLTGRAITDQERDGLLTKIHVQVLDLEAGAPLERAVLTTLAARGVPSPSAAWTELITLAMTLAKDRLSIDNTGLMTRLRHVLAKDEATAPDGAAVAAAVRSALQGQLPVAVEVLLYKEGTRTVIAEIRRFDEEGQRRLRFEDGQVTFPARGPCEVIRRAASMAGLERMLSRDPDLVKDHEVVIFEPGDFPNDDAPGVLEHRQAARQLLVDNPDLLACLRCGRPVSEDQAPYVEVDEVGETPEVGLVHWACLRPLHRVLGGISGEGLAHNAMLGDFDYRTWLRAVLGGQGLFNQAGPRLQGTISPIAWEPARSHLSVGTWGIVLQHADGNEHFSLRRGIVETFSESGAHEQATFANGVFAAAKGKNDPFCVSPTTQFFGQYSRVLTVAGDEGTPVEITAAVPREMSRAVLRTRQIQNYYAPLLALIDIETNVIFMTSHTVLLLTDPLRLPDMVTNWKAAGIEVPELGTAILANDAQVDALVASRALRGEQVAVDPILARDGTPISGFVFDPQVLWLADLTTDSDTSQEQA